MANDKLRFGILGTARIARRIVADMQSNDGIAVTAIASRDQSRAQWYANQYGIPGAFSSYDALLASDQVDAVYVPLPPSMHADWAVQAARAGKHVLVEKPAATSWMSAKEIDKQCRANNVQWLDATAWLHHGRTQRIRTVIDDGMLGKLRHISVACSFFEPFQSDDHRLSEELGGGCLLDLGWYAYGLARWAAGSKPSVHGSIGRRDRDVWFRCSSLLQFENDLTASVNCAYDTATRKWFEIAGDEASLVCDDFTRPWAGKPARFWIHDRAGKVTSEEFGGNQEANMLSYFVDCLSNDAQCHEMNRQALDTQQLCEDVYQQLANQSE